MSGGEWSYILEWFSGPAEGGSGQIGHLVRLIGMGLEGWWSEFPSSGLGLSDKLNGSV